MSDEMNSDSRRDGDSVLVAEYVLGLLPSGEHLRLAARMNDEPLLRAEQRMWRLRLSSLDREFAAVQAPANTLAKIEARLFGAASAAGAAGFWNSLALWRGLAAAGVAVAAIAIGFNVMTPRVDPKLFAEQLVAALQEEGSGVSFVALYDPTTGSVRLTALSGAEVPDKDYELWAIEGDQAPVSMGVVPVTSRADIKLSPEVMSGFGEGTVLAVTLEQKGGSPTGAPQGPVVAKGAATLI